MVRKILLTVLLSNILYSQQQVDIHWPTLADSPWPMIKHDPQFTGRSQYLGPQTSTVAWSEDMGLGIFSGPIVGQNGDLYFGSYYVDSSFFYCYTPNYGLRWLYQTGSNRPPQSGIIVDSGSTIYFGGRDNYLYALRSDGTLKWKYETSGQIVSTVIPNIDLQGNIYITDFVFPATQPGGLYSISPEGNLNWKIIYDGGFAFKSPVLSPDGNTIYIPAVDSNLIALNLDGTIKWKFSCGNIFKAAMVDSDGNIYFLPEECPQYFYSLFPNGTLRWKYFIQNIGVAGSHVIPTIDYQGNLYFIGFDTTCCPYYISLISVDYDGNFRWKYLFNEIEIEDFTQPLICDSLGTIYLGSTIGYSYYAISSDGHLIWKLPLILEHQQVDHTGAITEDGTLYLGVHNSALAFNQEKTLLAIQDTVTHVIDEKSEVISYLLEQNYPNPFNPTTTISYTILKYGLVTLKVFDILGTEVAELINEVEEAGSYSVTFNASELPSGIYFYTLTSGNFVDTKKFILLK
jgi:outer membrane protein assembly factor BamB